MSLYGILVALSILIVLIMCEYFAKKDGRNASFVWVAAPAVLLSAIMGARLYHVIDFYNVYSTEPLQIIRINQGGLGIPGGLIAGTLVLVILTKLKKENTVYWLNLVSTFTPLAQSIARWGNYFNREVYGKPTALPWGIVVDNTKIRYHPLFVYESILDLLLFIVLFMALKLGNRLVFVLYIAGYASIRFALEFLRIPAGLYGRSLFAFGLFGTVFLTSAGYYLVKRKCSM